MDNNNLKKRILISGAVLVIFALLGVSSIVLLKKEEKASYDYQPLEASSGTSQQKGFVMANKSSISTYGEDGKEIFSKDVKSNMNVDQYEKSEVNESFKISPDGRYAAVLESDVIEDENYSSPYSGNIITIVDLQGEKLHQLVKTKGKDVILSFSWDVSGNAIGFLTSKKVVYGGSVFDFFTQNEEKAKIYFNRVGLTDKSTFSSLVPSSEGYWNSFALISVDGTKYYTVTDGILLTVDKDKVEADTVIDNSNVLKVFISRDYRNFAAVDYSSITIYDLYGGEKRVLPFGNASSGGTIQVSTLDFSPDGKGIAFAKSETKYSYSSSKYSNGSADSFLVEDIWYYNLEDQSYKLIKTQQGSGSAHNYSSDSNSSLHFSNDSSLIMYSSSYDVATNKPFSDTKISIIPIDLSLPGSEVVIKQSKGYIIDWR